MKTMSRTNLPKECWVHESKRFSLYKYGFSCIESGLPYVHLKYESILKANNIPYQKITRYNEEVLEYWNPEVGLKSEDITLPLFAKIPEGYLNCEKNHTEKRLTWETMVAASVTQKFVYEEIASYHCILLEVSRYRYAKEMLDGRLAIMCHDNGRLPLSLAHSISMNHDDLMILRFPVSMNLSKWIAIFDMNKIATGCIITLQVPNQLAGLVIGKDGSNIKKWARCLGVKKIQVVPV